jgi:transposase
MERAMKVQEVILRAMAGKLKWWEAAEIIGVTDRTMRRWRERLNEHGYSGLWDYRKRRPSPKRVPMQTVEQVLQSYREQYFDFNVQHFHEKLREVHGIGLSYSWVKTALQTAGLLKRHKKTRHNQAFVRSLMHPPSAGFRNRDSTVITLVAAHVAAQLPDCAHPGASRENVDL